MTTANAAPLRGLHMICLRLLQRVGWAGIAGLSLLAVSTVLLVPAWIARPAPARVSDAARAVPAMVAASAPARDDNAMVSELPQSSDVPLLLTQMEQAALGNGLDWRAAQYRIAAATPTQPASLEVRCVIKGSYPKVRSMLVLLKASIPAFAIREFSVTRPNADTPDVEAKLALAVFLQDATTPVIATPAMNPTARGSARHVAR